VQRDKRSVTSPLLRKLCTNFLETSAVQSKNTLFLDHVPLFCLDMTLYPAVLSEIVFRA
jgi:hypothetical protein